MFISRTNYIAKLGSIIWVSGQRVQDLIWGSDSRLGYKFHARRVRTENIEHALLLVCSACMVS